METYTVQIQSMMKKYYDSLHESDKRRYAAIETLKLGHGGQKYICRVLGCDPDTILKGMSELTGDEPLLIDRIRQPGAGRKKVIDTVENIDELFMGILEDHTAGSPMEEIKWTNLNKRQIAEEFAKKGIVVSTKIIDQLLEKHQFSKRQAFKNETYKDVEGRDSQFNIINNYKELGMQSKNPVISVDVKKRTYR